MPEYNAVQTSRLESWLKRLLGVRNGGILPTVAPELGVAINLPLYADTDLLAGYQSFGAGQFIAAVAAQNAFLDVMNLSAGWLMLLRFHVTPGADTFIYMQMGAGLGGAMIGVNQAGWFDTRRPPASFPLNSSGLQIRQGTAALAFPTAANRIVWAGGALATHHEVTPWVILTPGGGSASVALNSVNVNGAFATEGYIRSVDPDELIGV